MIMSWGSSFIPALFPDDSLTHHLNTHTHTHTLTWSGRARRQELALMSEGVCCSLSSSRVGDPRISGSFTVRISFHKSREAVPLSSCWRHIQGPVTAPAETRRWGMRQRLQFFLNVNRLQPSSSQVFLNVSWIMTVLCSQLMILTSAKTNCVSGVCVPGLWGRGHQDDRWWRFRSLASATNLTFKSLRIVVFYWL